MHDVDNSINAGGGRRSRALCNKPCCTVLHGDLLAVMAQHQAQVAWYLVDTLRRGKLAQGVADQVVHLLMADATVETPCEGVREQPDAMCDVSLRSNEMIVGRVLQKDGLATAQLRYQPREQEQARPSAQQGRPYGRGHQVGHCLL